MEIGCGIWLPYSILGSGTKIQKNICSYYLKWTSLEPTDGVLDQTILKDIQY